MTRGIDVRVLTWNIFHGQDGARLGPTAGSTLLGRGVDGGGLLHLNRKWVTEMARVVAARAPTVAALQEVPPLAVDELARATGMTAARSLMRPLVGPTSLRGRLAACNPDLWRTHEGTANVLLIAEPWQIVPGGVWTVRHNPRSFVLKTARELSLGHRETLHWLLEPRVLVCARIRHPSGRTLTAVSLHCHNSLVWEVIAREVRRVVPLIFERIPPDEPLIVAGDLNAAGARHPAIRALVDAGLAEDTTEELVLDHVFHRGLEPVAPPRPTSRAARELGVTWRGMHRTVLLSDHDMVEAVYRLPTAHTDAWPTHDA